MVTKQTRRPLFISRYGQGQRETVSELEYKGSYRAQRIEARTECNEYRISDPPARYWVSTRACRDWLAR